MNDGDWMEAALTDESVVAELLLRLKHFVGLAPTSVESGSRQRRAKQVLEEKGEPARDSPSTPLSWSGGGTTASDASDSTRAAKAPGVRSKVCLALSQSVPPPVPPQIVSELWLPAWVVCLLF